MSILTNKQIENLKGKDKPYRILDSNGLYLNIGVSGNKSWQYRYQVYENEKRKDRWFTIGKYPNLSLKQARAEHTRLVFERENSLKNVVSDAVPMNASFSPELLVSIFNPTSPLHDGAVVIHNNLIEAAACILPLTESKTLNPEMGTRHRAALGISEESDALAVVISEESGKISVAENGFFISSSLSLEELGKILNDKMNEFIEEN